MQSFLVPQNFTDVTFNDNLQVYGLLNGYDIDGLFDDSVKKSKPALLKHVVFGKRNHSAKIGSNKIEANVPI